MGSQQGVVCPQGHWTASEAVVIIWGVGPGMLCSHSAQDAPNVSGGLYQQIVCHFIYVSFKNYDNYEPLLPHLILNSVSWIPLGFSYHGSPVDELCLCV